MFTVERLGKATAKYDDWPCFLEIMRLELTALTFVTTRPNKQALMALTAPKIENFGNF